MDTKFYLGKFMRRDKIGMQDDYIVTHIPIVRQRLGKQARNKYATSNRVDPLLYNVRNTPTQQ
jgi:hypothetical protein